MTKDTSLEYAAPILEAYPGMNITQLGMVMIYLASIRATLWHESCASTVRDYIHKEELSEEVAKCVDFLEREILCLTKSKVDIDYWKRGNKGGFRPDTYSISYQLAIVLYTSLHYLYSIRFMFHVKPCFIEIGKVEFPH